MVLGCSPHEATRNYCGSTENVVENPSKDSLDSVRPHLRSSEDDGCTKSEYHLLAPQMLPSISFNSCVCSHNEPHLSVISARQYCRNGSRRYEESNLWSSARLFKQYTPSTSNAASADTKPTIPHHRTDCIAAKQLRTESGTTQAHAVVEECHKHP